MIGVCFLYVCDAVSSVENDLYVGGMLLAFAIAFFLVRDRLRNIGTSGWFVLLMFIPIINFLISAICQVCPEGYRDTKKIDPVGKIIGVSIVIVNVVWFILYLCGFNFIGFIKTLIAR
jgi:uncharacterized membrane protein YhaH (DUF805 family)